MRLQKTPKNWKPLREGENPRDVLSNHRERGPARHLVVTYKVIAEAVGSSAVTVRAAARKGGFDPLDMVSVAKYVCDKRSSVRRRSEAPQISESKDLMTVADAAKYLEISRQSVYKAIGRGALDVKRIGRALFLYRESVEGYRSRNSRRAQPPASPGNLCCTGCGGVHGPMQLEHWQWNAPQQQWESRCGRWTVKPGLGRVTEAAGLTYGTRDEWPAAWREMEALAARSPDRRVPTGEDAGCQKGHTAIPPTQVHGKYFLADDPSPAREHVITKEEFEALSPHGRGFVAYWYGSREDQPNVPDERCPYAEDSEEAREWHRGQQTACLAAQDSEE